MFGDGCGSGQHQATIGALVIVFDGDGEARGRLLPRIGLLPRGAATAPAAPRKAISHALPGPGVSFNEPSATISTISPGSPEGTRWNPVAPRGSRRHRPGSNPPCARRATPGASSLVSHSAPAAPGKVHTRMDSKTCLEMVTPSGGSASISNSHVHSAYRRKQPRRDAFSIGRGG